MALPVLLAFDDDPALLAEVTTPLAQRYGREYRVESSADLDQAGRLLAELADDGSELALLLAGMTNADLFADARRLHPHAKRAMLVPAHAWTDEQHADAVRASLALGLVDHHVVRPAGPSDEVFHEAISDFLLEWARERRLVPQTVHIVGESWSGRAFELRETFAHCSVPHSFCLADSDEGRALLADAPPDTKLPAMILPDGTVLGDPSDAQIAAVAGAPDLVDSELFDVLIVGAGPAGLSAAVYSASEGLRVLVVDAGGIGGQARSSSLIRNYLGFAKGVSGSRLAEQAYDQAAAFGANFLFLHRVTTLEPSDDGFRASLSDGRIVRARAVILATGATYRRLGIESLESLTGAGVFYGGPASEAPGLTGKDVFVVGGGNSAAQAALHLARYARRVTVLVRAESLEDGMSHYLVQALNAAPNIAVRTGSALVGGGGDGHLQELVLREGAGADETVAADALFVLIGARPQTDWLPADLARDEHGFLLTGEDVPETDWSLARRVLTLETSVPGILAAGDVRHGSVKRVAAAVGEGSIAVQLVHRLLDEELQNAAVPEAGAPV